MASERYISSARTEEENDIEHLKRGQGKVCFKNFTEEEEKNISRINKLNTQIDSI